MFNIGGPEVLVIALIALIVVGPEQLPSVLRKAGKEMARFRSMTSSIRDEFMAGVEEMDPTTWDNAPRTAAKPISTPEEFRAHLDDEERQAEERAMGEVGRQEQQDKFSASTAKSESLMPNTDADSDVDDGPTPVDTSDADEGAANASSSNDDGSGDAPVDAVVAGEELAGNEAANAVSAAADERRSSSAGDVGKDAGK